MKRLRMAFGLQLALFVLEFYATVLAASGLERFQYYTEDSNFLAMISAAVNAFFLLRCMRRGKPVPAWARLMRLMSGVCLTVTFVVVVCVLVPMGVGSYRGMLFEGRMLYHHFLCPILAVAVCLIPAEPQPFSRAMALPALIPTVLYAAVTIPLNALSLMDGPYPFLRVTQQPWWMSLLWCILILGFTALISTLFVHLSQKIR